MDYNDLTGRRFGKLTVTKFAYKHKSGQNIWECQCDCGNALLVRGANLKSGFVSTCGCHTYKAVRSMVEPKAVIKAGQKVYFDPFQDMNIPVFRCDFSKKVTGTVVYVNYPHKWFSVEYGNPKMRTSFMFCQLGTDVKLSK